MLNHLNNTYLNYLCLIALFLLQCTFKVSCHGRLVQPPSRSTAWRYGFPTQRNYNDNELFCGGYTTQWARNGGKCGICGDSYSGSRPNELPDGKFTKPLVITANYSQGETVWVGVQLTANHRGKFVFKICPATSDKVEVTQECLDDHILQVGNSFDGKRDRYTVPDDATRVYNISLQLPQELTCSRCVLQWTYTAGNNWGPCGDGTSAVGCGPQETFRACADVHIKSDSLKPSKGNPDDDNIEDDIPEIDNNDLDRPFKSSTTAKPSKPTTVNPKDEIERESVTEATTRRFYPDVKPVTRPSWTPFTWIFPTHRTTTKSPISRETEPTTPRLTLSPSTSTSSPSQSSDESVRCVSIGPYRKLPGMDLWCTINCGAGFCPASHCKCG